MFPKSFIIPLAILVLIILGVWFTTRDTADTPTADTATQAQTTDMSLDALPIEVRFVGADGETIAVLFDNHAEVAILTGLGHEALMLPQVVAADGGRYESSEYGIVLWNKGEEVTVTEYDTVIFQGTTVSTGE